MAEKAVENRTIPAFKDEVEEGEWWVANQDLLLQKFEQAAKDGTLKQGAVAKRMRTPTTTIRLNPDDIALARKQAEERGLRYQTYLKMILHQALRKEEKSASKR